MLLEQPVAREEGHDALRGRQALRAQVDRGGKGRDEGLRHAVQRAEGGVFQLDDSDDGDLAARAIADDRLEQKVYLARAAEDEGHGEGLRALS